MGFFRFSEKLPIFEAFNTNTSSNVENYQRVPLCVTNHHHI